MHEPVVLPEHPIPEHFDHEKVGQIWNVPYQQRAEDAIQWAKLHHVQPASDDQFRIALIAIDFQNTFCIPGFELFVAGKSGSGAVDDNRRICEFIYRNLANITQITATLDTHTAMQIFHPVFLVDENGRHPVPMTIVSPEDLENGRWHFNPAIAASLGIEPEHGQKHLIHYTAELRAQNKYDLTIWPYHAMLGSIGHAIVPSVEEAIFFHSIARRSQADIQIKGNNPLTEHYSALGPEVLRGPYGETIAAKNQEFIQILEKFDLIAIAGEAKSHCVAWTISDLLEDILEIDAKLTNKVYLLEDCTSPVVVPDVIDYSDMANQAFSRFADAGMHIVRSIDPIQTWPNVASFNS